MSDPITPYRGAHFGAGYSAEYLRPGERTWRYVKDDQGRIAVYATHEAARRAAEKAYWSDPKAKRAIAGDLDEEALAAKIQAKAEDWLRVSRTPPTIKREPGKRPLTIVHGRARA